MLLSQRSWFCGGKKTIPWEQIVHHKSRINVSKHHSSILQIASPWHVTKQPKRGIQTWNTKDNWSWDLWKQSFYGCSHTRREIRAIIYAQFVSPMNPGPQSLIESEYVVFLFFVPTIPVRTSSQIPLNFIWDSTNVFSYILHKQILRATIGHSFFSSLSACLPLGQCCSLEHWCLCLGCCFSQSCELMS